MGNELRSSDGASNQPETGSLTLGVDPPSPGEGEESLLQLRLNRFLLSLQRQRLIGQHPVDDHLARRIEIDAVALQQIG